MNTIDTNSQVPVVTQEPDNSTLMKPVSEPELPDKAQLLLSYGKPVEAVFWAIIHRRNELLGQRESELIEGQLDNYLDMEDEVLTLDEVIIDLFTQMNQQLEARTPQTQHRLRADADERARRLEQLQSRLPRAGRS